MLLRVNKNYLRAPTLAHVKLVERNSRDLWKGLLLKLRAVVTFFHPVKCVCLGLAK